MNYAEFKSKTLDMVDAVLAKHKMVPQEFIDRVQRTEGVGRTTVLNSIGVVTGYKDQGFDKKFARYNKHIQDLVHLRTGVSERTSFGWFLNTMHNLLAVIDVEIAGIRNTSYWIQFLITCSTLKDNTDTLKPVIDELKTEMEKFGIENISKIDYHRLREGSHRH